MKISTFKSFPLIVTLLLSLVTLGVWYEVKVATSITYQEQFDFRVEEAVSNIESRMATYQQVLRGTRGLFDASTSVSRKEFKAYVTSLRIEDNFPGIQGVGFSLIIPPEQKQSHIASIRADQFPEYDINPAGKRSLYTSIIYLEPFEDRNFRAFGYDMYSNAVRREAMEQARDNDKHSMSGKVRLVQESGEKEQAGFLIYYPVYINDYPSDTLQNRRANIIGWVYSPFRMDDLMEGVFGLYSKDIDVEIFDGVELNHISGMYDSNSDNYGSISSDITEKKRVLQSTRKLEIAGRIWTINIKALPKFYQNIHVIESPLVLAIGLIASILSGVILWLLMQRRDRSIKQEQLELVAHSDLLTSLPNRSLFADRLSQALLQSKRNGRSAAVLFIDIDGFKAINDSYGHDKGDKLLITLAQRMKLAMREEDTLARFGGDEFVAVLAGLDKVEHCYSILKRLLFVTSKPVMIDKISIEVSASIGVTFYPQDNVDSEQLIRHADQAMYFAKEQGKNRYHIFDTAQDGLVRAHQKSLAAIRNALDKHQFVLHYQPKVNLRTGTVVGVEALIRWQHPERGLVPPLDFLPVIENHAMSIEIGEWVISTAITQISKWQSTGTSLPISVNIAAMQLQHDNFVSKLKAALEAQPSVKPSYLELEVLETNALDNVDNVSEIMKSCINLGVSFAIDDFGTGYSSLTYLRRLPASLIKIDKSFVQDMLDDSDDFAIVEGVIALAKSFQRDVIAEGVETMEHADALMQMGCELAQGYGIAKPMHAVDVPAWVNHWESTQSSYIKLA